MNPESTATEPTAPDGKLPRITCGCGFTVAGWDEGSNRLAYQDHDCPLVPAAPDRWYEHVFSFWGFAIVFAIGWAVVAVVAILNHWKG